MRATDAVVRLNNGAEMPLLAFGTAFSKDEYPFCEESVKVALLEAGYKHIDTAWYYYTEKYIGNVLDELLGNSTIQRDDIFVTTKVWPCFWNDPETSVNLSLCDLKLDYVDLLLQHWPVCFKKVEDSDGNRVPVPRDTNGKLLFDEDGDYLITYKKLLKIKDSGKAKAIGVSNYTIEMLERVIKETNVVPAVNQVELHPHLPQLELYEYCMQKGIHLEAYSPFGSTGAPNLKIPLVKELAEKYTITAADILVNYFISKKIAVLPRSTNIERIKKGYPLIELSKDDIKKLDDYGTENPKRFINDEWGVGLGFDHWNYTE